RHRFSAAKAGYQHPNHPHPAEAVTSGVTREVYGHAVQDSLNVMGKFSRLADPLRINGSG
ncbi:MAG: hypothetical protein WBQ79_16310, partial [Acidobacteriaceae bacterium]